MEKQWPQRNCNKRFKQKNISVVREWGLAAKQTRTPVGEYRDFRNNMLIIPIINF